MFLCTFSMFGVQRSCLLSWINAVKQLQLNFISVESIWSIKKKTGGAKKKKKNSNNSTTSFIFSHSGRAIHIYQFRLFFDFKFLFFLFSFSFFFRFNVSAWYCFNIQLNKEYLYCCCCWLFFCYPSSFADSENDIILHCQKSASKSEWRMIVVSTKKKKNYSRINISLFVRFVSLLFIMLKWWNG